MTPPSAAEPTLAERLWAHRAVEWLRTHDAWPDEEDFVEDPLQALTAVGVRPPASEACQRLLIDEVHRGVAGHAVWLAEEEAARWAEGLDGLAEESPEDQSVDPYGELSGGRYRTARWLCRRIDDPETADGDLDAIVSEDAASFGDIPW